jgi:hypothetical protein
LDKKTSDIENLPDGTTRFGDIIAGNPYVIAQAITNSLLSLTTNNFNAALEYAKTGISALESSSRTNVIQQEMVITPYGKGLLYDLAAESAELLGSNLIANGFAEKSVASDPNATNRKTLTISFWNLAEDNYNKGNFSNAFVQIKEAITNFEIIELSNSNLISKNDAFNLYQFAGNIAELAETNHDLIQSYYTRSGKYSPFPRPQPPNNGSNK